MALGAPVRPQALCLNHAARTPGWPGTRLGLSLGAAVRALEGPACVAAAVAPGPGIHAAGRAAGVGVPFPQSKRAPCSSHTCLPAGERPVIS